MSKRKRLWIIPVIVALVAVLGVFAVPGSVPGGSQGSVALAERPEGVVYKTSNGYSWDATKAQVEQMNELAKENPDISVGEVFEQVVPELLEVIPADARNFLYELKYFNELSELRPSAPDSRWHQSAPKAEEFDNATSVEPLNRWHWAHCVSKFDTIDYPYPIRYHSETKIWPHDPCPYMSVMSELYYEGSEIVDFAYDECWACWDCKAEAIYSGGSRGDYRILGIHWCDDMIGEHWTDPPPWLHWSGERYYG
jgi:hypothetical protein